MARRLTTTDGSNIINTMCAEMFGENATTVAIDGSNFASVGESIVNAGVENIINTLSLIISRDLIAIRPYKAKFNLINALDSGMFSNRVRKISYYEKNAVPTGHDNTDLYPENLGMGFDNGVHYDSSTPPVQMSTESQWYQSTPVCYQAIFNGGIEWQYPYTIYEDQLKKAFRSLEDWTDYLNGFLVSCANDLESEKEAFSRLTLVSAMAGVYDMASDMPGSSVNLTSAFNAKFGTSYLTADLLTTYFSEFLAFFVSFVKTTVDFLDQRSIMYHWSPTKTVNGVSYVLPRQTKREDLRMFMVSSFWNDAESMVLPAIFNDQYLKLENFEKIPFWQNVRNPYEINFTPAIPDTSDPTEQTVGATVNLKTVLGFIADKDAVMVDFHLENARSTEIEARKGYRTVWNTINKNPLIDYTENMVLLYMAD